MSPTYQLNFVLTVELLNDVPTEKVAGATGTHTPTLLVVGVTPHQVAHGTVVGHLLFPVNTADFIKGTYGGTESTMHTEDLVIDDGSQSQIIEDGGTVPPDICGTVLSKAFIVEPIHLCDLSAFVVSSDEGDSLGVSDFQG